MDQATIDKINRIVELAGDHDRWIKQLEADGVDEEDAEDHIHSNWDPAEYEEMYRLVHELSPVLLALTLAPNPGVPGEDDLTGHLQPS